MGLFDSTNDIPANQAGVGSTIDQAYINQFTPTGYENDLINAKNRLLQPEAIGPQGASALYPGIGQDINVGNYSGSIVGNNPIFVPTGNILAVDPILARQKALDDAARKRASQIKPWERPQVGTFKDPYFNKQLYSTVNSQLDEIVKQAQSEYGPDWTTVVQDRNTKYGMKVANIMNNADFLIKNVDNVTNTIATIENGLKDNSLKLSAEGMKAFNEYKNKIGNFEDINTLEQTNLPELNRKLQGIIDINYYIDKNDVLEGVEGEISQTFGVKDAGEFYKVMTTEKEKFGKTIDQFTETLSKTPSFQYGIENGIISKSDIKEAIQARLKDKYKTSGSITKKNEEQIAREGAENINAWDAPGSSNEYSPNAPKVVQYNAYDNAGNVVPNQKVSFDVRRDFNMNLAGGKNVKVNERKPDGTIMSQDFNGFQLDGIEVLGTDGKITTLPGNSVVKIGTMRELSDGTVIHDAEVARLVKRPVLKDGKPQMKDSGKKDKNGEVILEPVTTDSYVIEDLPIVVKKNGEGTGTKTKIQNQIKNSKKKEYYNDAFEKMGEKTKPSSENNVQYKYQGQSWSYDELKGAGWTDEQIKSLKQ